jgi:hypothetical protein
MSEGTTIPVSNKIVWALALAPFIGNFLELILATLVNGGDWIYASYAVDQGSYFLITVILNITLSYYDEKTLEKAGHDTSKFNGMTWLVPVYLFQRATALKHNMSYFAVWIILFVWVVIL